MLSRLLLLLLWHVHGQERPFVQAPKFQDVNLRTNVCDRQRELYEETIELRHALRGLNLTVAMTNYKVPNEDKFFTLENGKIKEKDPGLFVVIMDEIARRAEFSWRRTFAAVDPMDPEVDGNKTWTDMLEWEVNNFDIAADYWGRSEQRMARGISFPLGWYDGSIILAASDTSDSDSFSIWSYLLPFDWPVWLAILGAIVFTGFMYYVLERLNFQSDEQNLEKSSLVSIFVASLTFTGHYEFNPNTHAARILSFSWAFWALVMASAYTANMASFLVSRNGVTVYASTLEDAMKTSTPVCLQTGSVMDEVISSKYPDLTAVRKSTEQEIFQSLRKDWYGGSGGCGVGVTNLGTFQVYRGQKATNADCSLTSEKRVLLTLPSGFATAMDSGTLCTSLISYVMDLHLTEMRADGFIVQAWQDHLDKISEVDCPEQGSGVDNIDEDMFRLGLSELGGIFITHMILITVALCVALITYGHAKTTKPETLRPIMTQKPGSQNLAEPGSGLVSTRSNIAHWQSTADLTAGSMTVPVSEQFDASHRSMADTEDTIRKDNTSRRSVSDPQDNILVDESSNGVVQFNEKNWHSPAEETTADDSPIEVQAPTN